MLSWELRQDPTFNRVNSKLVVESRLTMNTRSKIYLFLEARALKRTNGSLLSNLIEYGTKEILGLSHSSLLVHS